MTLPRSQVQVTFFQDQEPETAPNPRLHSRARVFLGAALLLGLVLGTFGMSIRFGFIYTDQQNVRENLALRARGEGLRAIWLSPGATPHYSPLAYSAMLVQHKLFRGRAAGFHAGSIAIHACNVLLLWMLLRQLQLPGALFAAALFAVHPLQLEAVAWVSQQRILLCGAFYLLGLMCYLRLTSIVRSSPPDPDNPRRPTPQWIWWTLTLTFAAASVLCHPFGLSFPFVALALGFGMTKRLSASRFGLLIWLVVVGIFVSILMILAWTRLHSDESFDRPLPGLAVSAANIAKYLSRVVVPVGVPSLVGEDRNDGYFADHAMYLVLAAIAALLGATLSKLLSRMRAPLWLAPMGATLFVGTLATLTIWRLPVFRDNRSLWSDMLGRDPDSIPALNAIGLIELNQRKSPSIAIRHFSRALASDPQDKRSMLNLADAYVATGDHDLAINHYRKILSIDPRHPGAQQGLAIAYSRQSRSAEAVEILQQLVAQRPSDARAHLELGALFTDRGDYENAMKCYDQAIRIDPRNPAVYIESARMLYTGFADWRTAKALLERARQLDPTSVETVMLAGGIQFELAKQMAQAGAPRGDVRQDFWTAEMFFRESIRLRPDSALAHVNLGKCLGARSMYAQTPQESVECLNEAIFCFDRAIALDPADSESTQLRAKAQRDRDEAARKIR